MKLDEGFREDGLMSEFILSLIIVEEGNNVADIPLSSNICTLPTVEFVNKQL